MAQAISLQATPSSPDSATKRRSHQGHGRLRNQATEKTLNKMAHHPINFDDIEDKDVNKENDMLIHKYRKWVLE